MLVDFCRCHCPLYIKGAEKAMEDAGSNLRETLRDFSVCPYAGEKTQCSEPLETLKGHLQAALDAVEKSRETLSALKAKKKAI